MNTILLGFYRFKTIKKLIFVIILSDTIFHIRIYNNICLIDTYNRDLQTTIILFTNNVSSHKTDWFFFELPLPALSCLLYYRLSNLKNALEGKCLYLLKVPINVNKSFTLLLLVFFVYICTCKVVVARLLIYLLMLLLYFCLFVDHVNKFVVFVFGIFVYHFNNTMQPLRWPTSSPILAEIWSV